MTDENNDFLRNLTDLEVQRKMKIMSEWCRTIVSVKHAYVDLLSLSNSRLSVLVQYVVDQIAWTMHLLEL